jgi:hypothetical protein
LSRICQCEMAVRCVFLELGGRRESRLTWRK